MATGPIPQNQLNALPLLTAAQAAAAGELTIIGGGLYRYFSPTVLGINATPVVNYGGLGYYLLTTPYLDLRGCSKYVVTIRNTYIGGPGARGALPSGVLWAQVRQGPTDAPAPIYIVGATDVTLNNGMYQLALAAGKVFGAQQAAADSQTIVWAWADASPSSNGNNAVVLGANTRLVFSFSSNPVAATNLFTMTVEAQS